MRARASGPVSRRSSTRRVVTSSRWSRRYGMMMSRCEMLLSLTCFQYMTLLTYRGEYPYCARFRKCAHAIISKTIVYS